MKDLRRAVVTLVIASSSLAALMGVLALLVGGFGETEGRILVTTLIVGVESLALLCYLSLAGHRWVAVGATGALVSFAATGSGLLLTWSETADQGDVVVRLLGVSITIAATLAQASLLLRTAGRRELRLVLAPTLVFASVVAAMICSLVLRDRDPGATFVKLLGVVSILDVLGSVVLLALAVFGARRATVDRVATARGTLVLGPATASRVEAAAAEAGLGPDEVVLRALDALDAARRVAGGGAVSGAAAPTR